MKLVNCPQCEQRIAYSTDNPYRPFCSERCKMIDLGAWASESYKIAEPINSVSSSDLENDYRN